MSRYEAILVNEEPFATIRLADKETDSVAEVIPEIGCNLFRYEVEGLPVILPPPGLAVLKDEPFAAFKYGTPILSPPNRVKNAAFPFKQRTYSLPVNEPPHHLHGELCSRGWKVVQYGASEEQGAYVSARFRYSDYPEIRSYFPHDLHFAVTYRLADGQLRLSGTIVNEGPDEAPFAFGLHPYFTIPFDQAPQIELSVPAAAEWPVTNEAFVTGLPEETDFSRKLRSGVDITGYPLLGCSLLTLQEGRSVCKLHLRDSGYDIVYSIDPLFRYLVLFRPDWAQAFSLEPYTSVTDAFNLPYATQLTGARGIQPGEKLQYETILALEKKNGE